MTIRELENVLSCKDLEKICREIEAYGFRRVSKELVEELDYQDIANRCTYQETVVQEDLHAELQYRASMYKCSGKYEGVLFIMVTLSVVNGEYPRFPMPQKMVLFTDAL